MFTFGPIYWIDYWTCIKCLTSRPYSADVYFQQQLNAGCVQLKFGLNQEFKVQLISNCPFGVIISTKIPTKCFFGFCTLASQKRSNQKKSLIKYYFSMVVFRSLYNFFLKTCLCTIFYVTLCERIWCMIGVLAMVKSQSFLWKSSNPPKKSSRRLALSRKINVLSRNAIP